MGGNQDSSGRGQECDEIPTGDQEESQLEYEDENDLGTNKKKILMSSGDNSGILDDLCIAEGALEGEMADFLENGWSMKNIWWWCQVC